MANQALRAAESAVLQLEVALDELQVRDQGYERARQGKITLRVCSIRRRLREIQESLARLRKLTDN